GEHARHAQRTRAKPLEPVRLRLEHADRRMIVRLEEHRLAVGGARAKRIVDIAASDRLLGDDVHRRSRQYSSKTWSARASSSSTCAKSAPAPEYGSGTSESSGALGSNERSKRIGGTTVSEPASRRRCSRLSRSIASTRSKRSKSVRLN